MLNEQDKLIIQQIAKVIVPGISGAENRIDEVIYGFHPVVREAWIFYLRHFAKNYAICLLNN
jgi:hypothetical protein